MKETYWFIAYSSKNEKIAAQIVEIIKSCGIAYWKAPEMIPAGSNYAHEITNAVKNCSIFLFIMSHESQNSIWAEKELDMAISNKKKIIPIKIDNAPLNDTFLFYLNNVQIVSVDVAIDGRISDEERKKLYTKFMENHMPVTVPNSEPQTSIPTFIPPKTFPKIDTRSNAFRINKIPMQCIQCGGALEYVDVGTYRCVKCNSEHYDDAQKVRNYIRDNGPAPAFVIAKSTGVSKQAVEYFLNDDSSHSSLYIDSQTPPPTKTSSGGWHSNYGNNNRPKRFT